MTPSVLPPTAPRRARPQSGQGTAEFGGILAVAAVLVLALIGPSTTWGSQVSEGVVCAIGRIMGEECAAAPAEEEPTEEEEGEDRDYRPPQCTVRETNDGYSSTINLGIFEIGEDQYFVATETLVRNADGTYSPKITVVVTDGASLGLTGGVGPNAEFGDSSLGAEIEGTIGINAKYGDTWEFDSLADYEAFRQEWTDYEIQQLSLQNDTSGGYAFYLWLTDGFVDPPRSSDYSSQAFGWEGSVTGTLGAYIFGGTNPDGSEAKPFDLNIGGYAEVELGGSYLVTTDNRPGHEGERSTTYTFTGDASAGVNAVVVGGDVFDGTSQGAIEIKERTLPDGSTQITEITLTTTTGASMGWDPEITGGPLTGEHEGSIGWDDDAQHTTVTTTTLTVTDENRPIVEAWLAENNPNLEAGVLALPTNVFEPTTAAPSDDPFSNLLYEEAIVTRELFETTDENFNLALSLALGFKVGFDAGLTDEETTPIAAAYLDAPGPDGVRRFVDNTVCIQ